MKKAAEVLEWAVYAADDFLGNKRAEFCPDDIAAAARLAYCARVTDLIEKHAAERPAILAARWARAVLDAAKCEDLT